MARILMVSKSVTPPWNDSSKNLVRDVATQLRRHQAVVMTHGPAGSAPAGVTGLPIYSLSRARFAPALADNARVMAHLVLSPARYDLWHFFFAPNKRTSRACSLAARLRRMPTLQTVCSAPAADADLHALLFADRTVVLSRHTETRLLEAGIPRSALARIAPAVAPLQPLAKGAIARARTELGLPLERALVVYPGDLEFSHGAERMLRAHALLHAGHEVSLVIACRAKTAHAQAAEQTLRGLAVELGVAGSVLWLGETPRIHQLLGCADVVALPAENLYAKMDLPLVLIEAMLLARPVIVAQATAAAELCDGSAALAVVPEVEAIAAALTGLLESANARAELGVRARDAALARFDPISVASAYEALYDELLA
jgi:phosphatidylinositol alpha-1,6-mannosyltransferase